MNIHIREAREDDGEAVRDLLLHLAAGFRIPAPEHDFREVFVRQVADPDVDVFVAEVSGSLGRLAGVRAVLTQRYFSTLNLGGEQAYIAELVVHPLARRQGIASALLAHAAEVAERRGARLVEVKTHPRRAAARALYESAGMAETCLVLELPLTESARLVVDDRTDGDRKDVVA